MSPRAPRRRRRHRPAASKGSTAVIAAAPVEQKPRLVPCSNCVAVGFVVARVACASRRAARWCRRRVPTQRGRRPPAANSPSSAPPVRDARPSTSRLLGTQRDLAPPRTSVPRWFSVDERADQRRGRCCCCCGVSGQRNSGAPTRPSGEARRARTRTRHEEKERSGHREGRPEQQQQHCSSSERPGQPQPTGVRDTRLAGC
jgi:hypothetical protein